MLLTKEEHVRNSIFNMANPVHKNQGKEKHFIRSLEKNIGLLAVDCLF